MKTCSVCGVAFRPYTSLSKYCSHPCYLESRKAGRTKRWSDAAAKDRTGPNNPAYKHGMRSMGKRPKKDGIKKFERNAAAMKAEMLNEYGYYFCQYCGRTAPRIETHHIVYRSEMPGHENLHDRPNLILVDVRCHNAFHANKGMRNDIVIARGLDKIFGPSILNK